MLEEGAGGLWSQGRDDVPTETQEKDSEPQSFEGATWSLTFLETNPDPCPPRHGLSLVAQLSCPSTAKPASVRALLFDISFLMLCHVAQTYGSEAELEQQRDVTGNSAAPGLALAGAAPSTRLVAPLPLSQVILSESSSGAEVPFFETWMQTCMPEEGKILNPDHPCFRPDSTKVESLVALLNNSSEMKLVSVARVPTPRVVVGARPRLSP
ncbi:Mediator of RNA polymerase II transcription subunit 24 [Saguinus oedipus]|uniref:Mediator of RNA polymerase II transcription subunit 24 n=1 Tax=Saguinus oedipus TaxID=9490 RepID=A0ABQ9VR86_SAGOE|nr:Mediator of RNA polymerase II transcription subunit 24 [Saguinus oedipus]